MSEAKSMKQNTFLITICSIICFLIGIGCQVLATVILFLNYETDTGISINHSLAAITIVLIGILNILAAQYTREQKI